MSNQIYIGVDLGGTNIKVGICDEQGKLLHTFEGPTGAENGADFVLERIAQYVRQIVEESTFDWEQVAGIGAGLAGFMDIPEGFVKFSPNLQWHNVPAKKMLEALLGKTVKIDNDANVAALGEAWAGAERGFRMLCAIRLERVLAAVLLLTVKFIKVLRVWLESLVICPLCLTLKRFSVDVVKWVVLKQFLPQQVLFVWRMKRLNAVSVRH